MFKTMLLVILFFAHYSGAITITGARGVDNSWNMRFTHVPAVENIGAFKVTIRFSDNAAIASIATDAPSFGAWSQIKPEMLRRGNVLEVVAVGAAMLNSKIGDTLEMFHLSFNSSDTSQSESLFNAIIDSLWFSECYDIRGNDLVPKIATATVAGRQMQQSIAASKKVTYRDIGRVHSLTFNLVGQEMVKAWVIDANGKLITKLLNNKMEPGLHTIRWPESKERIATGIYFIQLEIQHFTYNKKVSYFR